MQQAREAWLSVLPGGMACGSVRALIENEPISASKIRRALFFIGHIFGQAAVAQW